MFLADPTFDQIFKAISDTPGVIQPDLSGDDAMSFSHVTESREHYVITVTKRDEHLVAASTFVPPDGYVFAACLLSSSWDAWNTQAMVQFPDDRTIVVLCSELNLEWSHPEAVQPFIRNLLSQLDTFYAALNGVLEGTPSDAELGSDGNGSSGSVFNSAMVGRIAETVITNWLTP